MRGLPGPARYVAREFQAHCITDEVIELVHDASGDWVEKVRANGRVVWGPDRKNLPRCLLRCEVRHWVAEQLLARSRQLSARPLFEPPTAPEFKILHDLFPALFFWHHERTSK